MQQIQLPELADGEIYLCGLVNASGDVTHTILLPAEHDPASWQDQMEWAKGLGADLPTRAELVVAYEQHREQFQAAAYWSNTQDADAAYSGWAWIHDFCYGSQHSGDKNCKLRARRCRRVIVQGE